MPTTIPTNHLKLVCSGTLFGGAEQYSWGLAMIPASATEAAPPTEVPAAVLTAVQDFHNAAIGPPAKMTMVKLNHIGTDGLYTRSQTVLHEYSTPFGGSTGANHPAQVALAISLLTDARRGLAARGRFYIPSPQATLDFTTGLIQDAARDTILVSAEALLNGLNAALPDWRVGVVGRASPTDPIGAVREVQRVRVGRVLDTIRSRRTALDEDYADGNVLTGFGSRYVGALGTSGTF